MFKGIYLMKKAFIKITMLIKRKKAWIIMIMEARTMTTQPS